MSDPDPALSAFLTLMQDTEFQREIAQIRTQSVLLNVIGDIPDYRWSFIQSRVIRNAIAGIIDLQSGALEGGLRDEEVKAAALRLAQLWESLADVGPELAKPMALLNAALAYDLAGYQANSSLLANRLLSRNRREATSIGMLETSTAFLQRQFMLVKYLGESLSQTSPTRAESAVEVAALAATAITGRAFLSAANFFLSNQSGELERAQSLFGLAIKGFDSVGLQLERALLTTVAQLLPVIRSRSIWNIIPNLGNNATLHCCHSTRSARVAEWRVSIPKVQYLEDQTEANSRFD